MKRLNNLYPDICKLENIIECFNEVRRNTKSQVRVENLRAYKNIYISKIHKILIEKNYKMGSPVIFKIYEPKERKIVSLNLQDKIVNHLVSRYILYPAILPCLLDINVASRKGLGTSSGLSYANEFKRKCKIKYGQYYILKCDTSSTFTIDILYYMFPSYIISPPKGGTFFILFLVMKPTSNLASHLSLPDPAWPHHLFRLPQFVHNFHDPAFPLLFDLLDGRFWDGN